MPAEALAGRSRDLEDLAALLAPERREDPYSGYAALRESQPVWRPTDRLFVLSRHRDCAAVLRDPRFGHAEGDGLPARRARGGVLGGQVPDDGPPVRSFLGLDPPDHTRLRRLVSRSFTPRRVEELVPQVRRIVRELLDGIRASAGGTVDLVGAFARPLPVRVISELLGVPPDDRPRLMGWSRALAKGLDPAFLVTQDERVAQAAAREEFAAYLTDAIADRRRSPRGDLLSALVTTHDRGDTLTQTELVATCILLLIAGHETTTSLIGNGMLALLRHPEQLIRLRRHPELSGSAVEELLRFDSPVQLTMRTALREAAVGEVAVPRGAFVLLLLGAANRDPEIHPDPDRLDIARTPNPQLAFGQGIHFCLGAPLARMEARLALRALTREARLCLSGSPVWKDTVVLRGVRRLEVAISLPGARGDPGTRGEGW